MYDICIIGAGASGMCAAITAKEKNPQLKIIVLEKKAEPGKKLLATGNGKCNLSNLKCEKYRETLGFFQHIGILTRNDSEGRLYPYTEDSRVVVECLHDRLKVLGIELKCNSSVEKISHDKTFSMKLRDCIIESKKVLIACGGKSAPKLGTSGDGYSWAKALGHSINKVIPALTAVDVLENTESLAGIRAKASVKLIFDDHEIFEEEGEVQFTKTGVSGICVFNLSRFLLIPEGRSLKEGFCDYHISIDFFPKIDNLNQIIEERLEFLDFTIEKALRSLVRPAIAKMVLERSKGNIDDTVSILHDFKLSPKVLRGWDFAQVTKGGVNLEEIDWLTMESKLLPNLYFSGEILDYDGPCGGFNLQNAWETGLKAGRGMASV